MVVGPSNSGSPAIGEFRGTGGWWRYYSAAVAVAENESLGFSDVFLKR